MTRVGIAARLALQAAAFLVLAPVQFVALRFRWRIARHIPVAFHRLFLWLFGIRVSMTGEPPGRGTPVLILANHVSWLDIMVIGSLRPLSFVAKQEIAGWPVFGLLAKMQRCIFIDRTRKAATASVNAKMAERLGGGDAIVLFPEGTTGDGNRLLPFKSSLVGAAGAALGDGGAIRLQPLAIRYVARGGLPVTRRDRPGLAWYGDMDLLPHLGAMLAGAPVDVAVHWGEPVPFGDGTDRKKAAALAEAEVRAGLRS